MGSSVQACRSERQIHRAIEHPGGPIPAYVWQQLAPQKLSPGAVDNHVQRHV